MNQNSEGQFPYQHLDDSNLEGSTPTAQDKVSTSSSSSNYAHQPEQFVNHQENYQGVEVQSGSNALPGLVAEYKEIKMHPFVYFVSKNKFLVIVSTLGLISLIGIVTAQFVAAEENRPSTLFGITKKPEKKSTQEVKFATSFEECKNLGNPITQSFPPQCSSGGKTFVQELSPEDKSKTTPPAPKPEVKPVVKTKTYTSVNYPNLKITYPENWKIDLKNEDFKDADGKSKDDKNKTYVIGVITFTKENYEVQYKVTPDSFPGYGPNIVCEKDTWDKVVKGTMGRVRLPDSGNFKYTYGYKSNLISPEDPNLASNFGIDSPYRIPGKPSDYDSCYTNGITSPAGTIVSNYTKGGKKLNAFVEVTFKIKGENLNEDIFKEVDDIVVSSSLK